MAKPPMFGTMFEDAARRKKEEKEKAMEEKKTVDDNIPGQQSFEDHPEVLPKTDTGAAAEGTSSPTGEKDKTPATAEKSEKTKKKIPQKKKAESSADPEPAPVKKALTKEKPVSLYLEREDKLKLKALSAALDLPVSELMRIAIRDYIQNRPLSEAEKAVFNSKLQSLIDK